MGMNLFAAGVAALIFLAAATTSSAQTTAQTATARTAVPEKQPFDPATYVRIYEETKDKRILLYEPSNIHKAPTLLRIDADSKIVVELDPQLLGTDMALNGLYMTAELSRVDPESGPVKVEVVNYSEIAADPKTQASQAGVALRTAGQVHVVMQNLYDLTADLVANVYEPACSMGTAPPRPSPPTGCSYQRKNGISEVQAEDILRQHLGALQPRVDAIAEFFTSDSNGLVVSEIGVDVFGIDFRSLKATAAKLKTDVAVLTSDQSKEPTRAGQDILLTLPHLWNGMQPLRLATQDPKYFENRWREVVLPHFHQLLAPGTIDLRKYKAADGETLTLAIQARAAGGEGSGGITRDFQFAIKKLHPRVTTEPSAFYLHRLGDVRDDKGKPISTNFAPAPGVTFGVVFYSRPLEPQQAGHWIVKESGRSRVWSALAPGIGMNVSLMNFAANDFDPSIANDAGQVVGGFRTTNSTAIQVGFGASASLFANALQFTYGVNLNVSEERRYFGIGFGFIEVGQQIAKFVKK